MPGSSEQDLVNIITSTGARLSVPRGSPLLPGSRLETPEEGGYRIEQSSVQESEAARYSGTLETAAAGLQGVASSLTLGLSDAVFGEEGAKLAEHNKGARLTGGIVGFAPMLLSGPVGAASKASLTGIVSAKTAALGKTIAAKARSSLVGTAAGTALEGVAWGAGQEVSKAIISDEPLSASAVAGDIGLSALFGAGIGVIAVGAGKAAGALETRRIAQETVYEKEVALKLAEREAKIGAKQFAYNEAEREVMEKRTNAATWEALTSKEVSTKEAAIKAAAAKAEEQKAAIKDFVNDREAALAEPHKALVAQEGNLKIRQDFLDKAADEVASSTPIYDWSKVNARYAELQGMAGDISARTALYPKRFSPITAQNKADRLLGKLDTAIKEQTGDFDAILYETETAVDDLVKEVSRGRYGGGIRPTGVSNPKDFYLASGDYSYQYAAAVASKRAAFYDIMPEGLTVKGINALHKEGDMARIAAAGKAYDDYMGEVLRAKKLDVSTVDRLSNNPMAKLRGVGSFDTLAELGGIPVASLSPTGKDLFDSFLQQKTVSDAFIQKTVKEEARLMGRLSSAERASLKEQGKLEEFQTTIPSKGLANANDVLSAEERLAQKRLELEVTRNAAFEPPKGPAESHGGLIRRIVRASSGSVGRKFLGGVAGSSVGGLIGGQAGWVLGGVLGAGMFDTVVGNAGLVAKSTTSLRGRITHSLERSTRGVSRVLPRLTPVAVFNSVSFGNEGEGKDTREAASNRMRELSALVANPEQLRNAAFTSLTPIRLAHSGVGSAAVEHTLNLVKLLYDKMPKDPGNITSGGRSIWRASDLEISKWARYVAAAELGAAGILDEFVSGNGSPEMAEIFREGFPDAARIAFGRLVELMGSVKLPKESLTMYSMLFDIPMESMLRPDRAAANAATFRAEEQKNLAPAQAASKNAAPSVSDQTQVPQNLTPAQMLGATL